MKLQLFIGLMLALLLAPPAWADWQGQVVEMRGSGEFLVLHTDDNRNLTVRLYGLACPDPDQPFGQAAESLVHALVVAPGRPITVLEERRDAGGRILATVVLYDGTTLNDRLLLAGLAWVYPENCVSVQGCQNLMQLQKRARHGRRGLWSQESWQQREQRR